VTETAIGQLVCPTLVGRARELDAVAALAEASAVGHCELALIAGEAGVGKTRLLEEARRLERLERAASDSPSPETRALYAQARGELAEAAAAWAALGRPYDRARALRRLGEATGDVDVLEQARAVFADLGAEHERDLAQAALRRAGARVPRGPHARTRAAPGGLTAREIEVARLIADGATNADIARALVVAPKTVAAHVSHILAKLGFSSRVQIAGWVAEHGRET
jgi:DNA-binding CsgD family transcriptional regulator